jgi:hypothetical protein
MLNLLYDMFRNVNPSNTIFFYNQLKYKFNIAKNVSLLFHYSFFTIEFFCLMMIYPHSFLILIIITMIVLLITNRYNYERNTT